MDLTPGPFPKGKGSLLVEQRRLVAYLDGLQAQVAKVRGMQDESARELDAMMPSILDRAFKGEL